MKYMGSKARIAKHILPIILKNRKPGQYYVEPFVGGANLIDKVDGNRIGADINEYLIALLQALASGWLPPEHVSKEEYYALKADKDTNKALTAWAGFGCSYCGKWFGGWANDYKEYRRSKAGNLPNHQIESRNSVIKQALNIEGVTFKCSSYDKLEIPDNSIIYCDPPYEGTTGYKTGGFNHAAFWQWCRDMSDRGHTVYVSEYNAPEDFTAVWQGQISTTLARGKGKKATEKLFVYTGDIL